MKRKIWTTQDDKIIKDEYAHAPTQRLAKKLGRTKKAVSVRASVLGLKKETISPKTKKSPPPPFGKTASYHYQCSAGL